MDDYNRENNNYSSVSGMPANPCWTEVQTRNYADELRGQQEDRARSEKRASDDREYAASQQRAASFVSYSPGTSSSGYSGSSSSGDLGIWRGLCSMFARMSKACVEGVEAIPSEQRLPIGVLGLLLSISITSCVYLWQQSEYALQQSDELRSSLIEQAGKTFNAPPYTYQPLSLQDLEGKSLSQIQFMINVIDLVRGKSEGTDIQKNNFKLLTDRRGFLKATVKKK